MFAVKEKYNLTYEQTSERFDLPIRTLFRWQNKLEPCLTRNKPATKVDMDALKDDVELHPNGSWNVQAVRKSLKKGDIHYSSWINPFEGSVPIGFAGAVSSDNRLHVNVLPSSFISGANIKLTATLTDREWPAPNGSVTVAVQSPSGVQSNVTLFDDGSHGDEASGDAIWTNTFSQTAETGIYKLLFRSMGTNERGELGPREASRNVTLQLEKPPTGGGDCIACQLLRWLLALAFLLLLWIWYCTCGRRLLGSFRLSNR